jgi:hypothetical protein
MDKYEAMAEYRKELGNFQGDKALFWAGRMAQTIKVMTSCSPLRLSGYIELLDLLREEYDRIIFSRGCI